MSSTSSHLIKGRKNAKDVFITPKALAKMHIDMVPDEYKTPRSIWLDPCANSNVYFDQFPKGSGGFGMNYRCEILEGTSFFDCTIKKRGGDVYENPQVSYYQPEYVICSNPPYSILDDWFKKTIELNPDCFSYLIGIGNLTARRIEWCEKAGYGLTKMKMLKVKSWYGMSIIVVFEKNKPSIMTIDRKVWYPDNE